LADETIGEAFFRICPGGLLRTEPRTRQKDSIGQRITILNRLTAFLGLCNTFQIRQQLCSRRGSFSDLLGGTKMVQFMTHIMNGHSVLGLENASVHNVIISNVENNIKTSCACKRFSWQSNCF
jgi:hypothetical protein